VSPRGCRWPFPYFSGGWAARRWAEAIARTGGDDTQLGVALIDPDQDLGLAGRPVLDESGACRYGEISVDGLGFEANTPVPLDSALSDGEFRAVDERSSRSES
jgi:hypothetical protein